MHTGLGSFPSLLSAHVLSFFDPDWKLSVQTAVGVAL